MEKIYLETKDYKYDAKDYEHELAKDMIKLLNLNVEYNDPRDVINVYRDTYLNAKPATEKQIEFAQKIADALSLELPVEANVKDVSEFIDTHKEAYSKHLLDSFAPSEKQVAFAERIANTLGLEVPKDATGKELSEFIDANKDGYFAKTKGISNPTAKQKEFAEVIAKVLELELPNDSFEDYGKFINDNKDEYYKKTKGTE